METKRTEANRNNARKSTGPKTPEGKAVVARNAIRHGLLSQQVYREEHEEAELRRLAERLCAQLQPVGAMEELLVNRIVSNAWRLRRLLEVEAMYQDYRVNRYVDGPYADEHGHTWSNIESLEKVIDQSARLTRYESFLERSTFKALHELQRLQAARAGVPVPVPLAVDLEVSCVDLEPEALQEEADENGFVS